MTAGWPVFQVDFESLAHAQFMALGFGPRARVLAPEELCRRVCDDFAAAAAIRTA